MECFWLDDQGRLQEGFQGVFDALESDFILVRDARPLWRALKKRFHPIPIVNRTDWMLDLAELIRTGDGVLQWELS